MTGTATAFVAAPAPQAPALVPIPKVATGESPEVLAFLADKPAHNRGGLPLIRCAACKGIDYASTHPKANPRHCTSCTIARQSRQACECGSRDCGECGHLLADGHRLNRQGHWS